MAASAIIERRHGTGPPTHRRTNALGSHATIHDGAPADGDRGNTNVPSTPTDSANHTSGLVRNIGHRSRTKLTQISKAMCSGELPFDVDAGAARRQPVPKEIIVFQRRCILSGPQVPAIGSDESMINQIRQSGRGQGSTECGSGQSRYLS